MKTFLDRVEHTVIDAQATTHPQLGVESPIYNIYTIII